MADLATMYGREGEALERYQLQREGGTFPLPSECDLCAARLSPTQQVPQTIEWRTKEKKIGTEHKVLVKVDTFQYQKQSGTYFLCPDCRETFRPPLKTALPKAVIPALILAPFAYMLGGPGALVWPALLCGGLLMFFMRSQFKGYPASLGFRVHQTTFDGPEQRMIMPVFILITLLFLGVGLLSGGSGIPLNLQLGRLDGRGGEGTVNMAAVDQALQGLWSVAGESPGKGGDKVVKGWMLHRQRADHLYPNSSEFIKAVTEVLKAGKPAMPLQSAVDLIAKETAGQRLARRQQGTNAPPFAQQSELETGVIQLLTRVKATPWDAVQAVEQITGTLKAVNTPVATPKILQLLMSLSDKQPRSDLPLLTEAAQAELLANAAKYQ